MRPGRLSGFACALCTTSLLRRLHVSLFRFHHTCLHVLLLVSFTPSPISLARVAVALLSIACHLAGCTSASILCLCAGVPHLDPHGSSNITHECSMTLTHALLTESLPHHISAPPDPATVLPNSATPACCACPAPHTAPGLARPRSPAPEGE